MKMIMGTNLSLRHKTLGQLRAERSLRTLANAGKDGYGNNSISISGGYSRLHLYLRGNHVQDMRKDWLMVGDAFRNTLRSYKR